MLQLAKGFLIAVAVFGVGPLLYASGPDAKRGTPNSGPAVREPQGTAPVQTHKAEQPLRGPITNSRVMWCTALVIVILMVVVPWPWPEGAPVTSTSMKPTKSRMPSARRVRAYMRRSDRRLSRHPRPIPPYIQRMRLLAGRAFVDGERGVARFYLRLINRWVRRH